MSGVGRPAAGKVENAMYEWFGGIVGRAWPGVGLALRPVVSDEDADKVCPVIRRGVHLVQTGSAKQEVDHVTRDLFSIW